MSKPKEEKVLIATQVLPDKSTLLMQLYALLATETARVASKQEAAGNEGASYVKQLGGLVDVFKGVEEEKGKIQKEDAINMLTDEQRMKLLADVVKELPAEDRHLLLTALVDEDNE